MGFLAKFSAIIAVLAALLAVGFQYSLDVRYNACMVANFGYLDFMGPTYTDYWERCLADASDQFLRRDFPEGGGSLTPIHEADCSNGFTFEQFRAESKNFTIPFVCRGLIKENKCRNWSLEYYESVVADDYLILMQDMGNYSYPRKAFSTAKYPHVTKPAVEAFQSMREQEPLFLSFDNDFIRRDYPTLVNDLNLDELFPGQFFVLNSLFFSNFPRKIMGSPFHAAPNDNFFFQCRGRKHWYYIEPKYLPYTGAFLEHGVTYVSGHVDEEAILSRLPVLEARIEEGDAMYNPPYWLHAVGTPQGLTISVANRMWQNKLMQRDPTTFYWDALYKLQFPIFAWSVAYTKLNKLAFGAKNVKMNAQHFRIKEPKIPEQGFMHIMD